MRVSRLFAVIALAASPLAAQSFTSGDLVVRGVTPRVNGMTSHQILWLDPGALKGILLATDPVGVVSSSGPSFDLGFDSSGRLHEADYEVIRIAPNGSVTAQSQPLDPYRLAFAANGHVFVLSSGRDTVAELDSSLAVVRSIPVGPQAEGIDLAADQCSLYYMIGFSRSIEGVNVCTGEALPSIALPETSYTFFRTLRIVPGGFLYSGSRGVTYIDPAGHLIRAYRGFEFALDPDRTSFWTKEGTSLYKIRIDDGSIVRGPIDISDRLQEILTFAVANEPRAALVVANAPAISPVGLLCLGVCLAVVAMVMLRQHLL